MLFVVRTWLRLSKSAAGQQGSRKLWTWLAYNPGRRVRLPALVIAQSMLSGQRPIRPSSTDKFYPGEAAGDRSAGPYRHVRLHPTTIPAPGQLKWARRFCIDHPLKRAIASSTGILFTSAADPAYCRDNRPTKTILFTVFDRRVDHFGTYPPTGV